MKILYGAHTCRVIDINRDEELILRDLTSYKPKDLNFNNSQFVVRDGKRQFNKFYRGEQQKYLYNLKTKLFPTGLITLVAKNIKKFNIEYSCKPLKAIQFSVNDVSPREYQKEAWKALTEASRGIAELPTGTGKCLVSCMLASSYPDNTVLITVPNKGLLKQNHRESEKFLNTRVGILGDKEFDLDHSVVVATIQSLVARIESKDKQVMDLLTRVDVWISDESHGAAAESYRILSANLPNAHNRYGLTATWMREDGCELVMEGVLGSSVYKYTYEQAFKDGFLTPPRIWLKEFEVPLARDGKRPTFLSWYKKRITNFGPRNIQILLDASTLVDEGLTPAIVLVNHIDHGNILAKALGVPFINGDNSTKEVDKILEDLCNGTHKIIVASGILNVGIDLKPLRAAINAAAGDSRITTLQKIGRGMRLYPGKEYFDYIDYYDIDNYYFSSHSSSRRYTYKQNFKGRVFEVKMRSTIHKELERLNVN